MGINPRDTAAKENRNKSSHCHKLTKILMTPLSWSEILLLRVSGLQPQADACHRDCSLKCLLVVRQFPLAVGEQQSLCLYQTGRLA